MKRTLATIVVLLLLVSGLFAAGQGEGGKAAPELIVQLMADSPPDKDLVTDAINEVMLDRLNCTVKFQNLTWTDWQQKYRLLLTSGEKVDILYAANWNSYADYSRDGAYVKLDDLLPVAVPKLYNSISDADWDGVKINGEIYAVPDLKQSYSGANHLIYREDLRQKYGTPPITDMRTAELFFDAIKKNEPSMYPVQTKGDAWVNDLFTYMVAKGNPNSAWHSAFIPQSQLLFLDFKNPYGDMKAPWEMSEYQEFLQTMRRWAQKGFWSEDILSEKNPSQDLVEAGKSAAGGAGMNVDKVQKYIERIRENTPSWDVSEFSWDQARGFSIPAASQQDMSTIPLQSKHPEKGLQVIEGFLMDKDLQFLVHYGIDGVHYEVTPENQYRQLPGSKNYGIFAMNGWGWKNEGLLLPQIGGWGAEHFAYYKLFDSIAVPNFGFAVDRDSINAEMTALKQVEEQYGWPLWSGLVDDVDEGSQILQQKLKEAGYEKVRAEIQKQFRAYLKEIGR
jgi:putative aldouronate transport system substrate-binding protein